MKKLLSSLIGLFLLLSGINSYAYNQNDLENLIKSKKCGGFFSSCDLKGAILVNLDLSNAEIKGADLSNAYIENTKLSGADMAGVNLTGATLKYVDLAGADISGANMEKARLIFVELSVADMSDVKLKGAVFNGVYLKRTNCSGVDFNLVDTRLVDFSGALQIGNKPCLAQSYGRCNQ